MVDAEKSFSIWSLQNLSLSVASKLLESNQDQSISWADLHGDFIVIGKKLWTLFSGGKKRHMRCLSPARPQGRGPGRSRWSYHAEVLYGIKRPKQSLWSHMLAVGQSSGRMLPSISPWSRAGWWGRRKWEAMRSSHGISGLGPQWQRKPPARPTFLTDWAAAARHPSYRWGLQTVMRGHMWDL